MMWETEKDHLSVSLESVLLGKASEGHTEESNRKNLEILANLGQDICRKTIPSRLGGGEEGEQVKAQVLLVHCHSVGRIADVP